LKNAFRVATLNESLAVDVDSDSAVWPL